jgi:DNA replication and repair protein RecF
MLLKEITLKNFRSFSDSVFEFNPKLTIILGNNSVGKTNLLEAIYCLSKGHGFREKQEEELLKHEQTTANIQSLFLNERKEKINFRIHLSNQSAFLKACFVDKIKKRTFDYALLTTPAVIFSPNMLYIIDGEIAERREFFDDILSILDKEYKKRLSNYTNSLKRRNKVLEKVTDISQLKDQLVFWDTYLIEEASYITKKREELVEFLNNHPTIQDKSFSIVYLKNEISKKTLEDTFQKQLYVHKTVVGPQRDNYEIHISNPASTPHTKSFTKNVHRFGSRSEQRLALFWIVINEIKLYEESLKKKPIILLDDIFSELDESNKALILNLIKDYQTIVTTTEMRVVELSDVAHTIIQL